MAEYVAEDRPTKKSRSRDWNVAQCGASRFARNPRHKGLAKFSSLADNNLEHIFKRLSELLLHVQKKQGPPYQFVDKARLENDVILEGTGINSVCILFVQDE